MLSLSQAAASRNSSRPIHPSIHLYQFNILSMARLPTIKKRKFNNSRDAGNFTETSRATSRQKTASTQSSKWDVEQDYEIKPRKRKKGNENTRLPTKNSDGVIQPAPDLDEEDESESEIELSGVNETTLKSDDTPDKPVVSYKQQIIDAQEELAKIAILLRENDPEEHVGALKTLAQFAKSPNITIKKYALMTQLKIYKDLIPGYRIRQLSEEDMKTKVGKEVKRLRAYEQGLVGGYYRYIQDLSKLAHNGGGGKTGGENPSLCSVAISCACALLIAVPHFNFRGELLKIIVKVLSSRKIDADFIKCRQTIETLFREDEDGNASLDAVILLTKMMKGRGFHIDESVLNTFLHLRLLTEFSGKASTNSIDREEKDKTYGKKLKEKRVFRTKKERKLMKEREAVEKEMKVSEAIVSHEERDHHQAEILKKVFVTYFQILKTRSPNLMGAVLEGLASHAHLINQEFFGDILEALKDLIRLSDTQSHFETEEKAEEPVKNHTREALLCIVTALTLLEGQDAAKAQTSLCLDLSFFVNHLYRTLTALSLNPNIELSTKSLHLSDPSDAMSPSTTVNNKINIQTTMVLLLRSISSVLTPTLAARAVPPLRIAAFTKQLLTSSLHIPENSCIALISFMEKLTKIQQKKIAPLWNTEDRRGDGVFNALCGEAEASNPFATTIWEGELLRKHFSPGVRDRVKTMEKNILGLR
ncbi:BgTH12-07701 [Blumeria graminis f. sp. triticale]|uniref:Nucleolar complex-associated protein 3 n=1 Tax=Blumeria graminis f. sp. triticale TaxID=1689686 RepID=A0A9W4D987_BLUGR|nr:BgTH12-07701 [Blumeria graminis f. sp. triticale]